MKKISVMLVLASVLMSFIIGAVAEPVLPKYVVPLNNRTNVRSETWLIPFDNTYVAIEAICFSLSDMMCYECITYTPISFSEYYKATNETQTSISNDL